MQRVLRKKHTDLLFSLFLLVLLAFSVTHMAVISEGVFSALTLCARAIIPTLFPFLILTDLLLSVEGTEKILSMISFPLAKLLRLPNRAERSFCSVRSLVFPWVQRRWRTTIPRDDYQKKRVSACFSFAETQALFF